MSEIVYDEEPRKFPAGMTWDDTWEWIDGAGTFVDTALFSAELQIRSLDLETLYFTASTANGYLAVGRINTGTANQSNIRVNVPPAVTAAVENFGKAAYALDLTDALGAIPLRITGYMRYAPDIVQ